MPYTRSISEVLRVFFYALGIIPRRGLIFSKGIPFSMCSLSPQKAIILPPKVIVLGSGNNHSAPSMWLHDFKNLWPHGRALMGQYIVAQGKRSDTLGQHPRPRGMTKPWLSNVLPFQGAAAITIHTHSWNPRSTLKFRMIKIEHELHE